MRTVMIVFSILFFVFSSGFAVKYTNDKTYLYPSECKEFTCQHGYVYDTFFSTDKMRKVNGSDIRFEMHLAILAPSNGHILLSSKMQPQRDDPVYEIVVGGGGNLFTELRRNLRRNAKVSKTSVGILSAQQYKSFYLRINGEGVVEFGRLDDPLPLLSYFDVDPIPIRYISFAAWNGVEAKFLFDCPSPIATTKPWNTTQIEPEPRKVSKTQQLKNSLLKYKSPYTAPSTPILVNIGTRFVYVNYDAFNSVMTTGISIILSWTDNSMAWNPNKFFNITSLKFVAGSIWQPKLFVSNSIAALPLQSQWGDEPVLMVNSGEATLFFYTEIKTFCTDDHGGYSNWPRDQYRCPIVLQPWDTYETILLQFMSLDHEKMKLIADLGTTIKNEWKLSVLQAVVPASKWNEIMYNSYNDSSMHISDRLIINISLKRRATTYNIVFYTPLLVLVTFVLMSFWSEPLTMSRVWFYIGVTIVLCAGLCYIDTLIPCHTTPTILILYNTVLFGVLFALILQLILMTETVEKLCKSEQLQFLLTISWIRNIFCLPQKNAFHTYETVNEACSFDPEDISPINGTDHSRTVEELQSDHAEPDDRVTLAECIDKTMFVIYTVVVAVMLAMHF